MVQWEIKGRELATCNCSSGCPCQFNSLPTHGNCEAAVGLQVDEGHFDATKLDGLRAVALLSWPGAIHEGHGRALLVIDERANEKQRDALLKILTGQETEPGATVFNVFASTLEHAYDPLFKPIAFEVDVDGRTGRFSVSGVVEARGTPIVNPVTGEPHRAQIRLPNGFEYRVAEIGRGESRAEGPIAFTLKGTHAHFVHMHLTQSGVVS